MESSDEVIEKSPFGNLSLDEFISLLDDLKEVPKKVLEQLTVIPVETMDDVFKNVFKQKAQRKTSRPTKKTVAKKKSAKSAKKKKSSKTKRRKKSS